MTPEIIKSLHHAAIKDIYACAGQYREWPVRIKGSVHKPPHHANVPGLVENMCETVNGRTDWTSIETAAYLLWRVNWIHPFGGGNGRTARAVCYLGLCVRESCVLPGEATIPTQIVNDRENFLAALRDADEALNTTSVSDVSKLAFLMDGWLRKQLDSVPAAVRPVIARSPDDPTTFEPGRVIYEAGRPPSQSVSE